MGDRHAHRAFLSCPHEALGPGPDPCILAPSVQWRDPWPEIQKAQFHATETLGNSQPSLRLHSPICPVGTGPQRRVTDLSLNALWGSRHRGSSLPRLASPPLGSCSAKSCPSPPGGQPPPPPEASRLDIRTQEWQLEGSSQGQKGRVTCSGSTFEPGLWSPAHVMVTTPGGSTIRVPRQRGPLLERTTHRVLASVSPLLGQDSCPCPATLAHCLPTSFPAWGWGISLAARPDRSPGCASNPPPRLGLLGVSEVGVSTHHTCLIHSPRGLGSRHRPNSQGKRQGPERSRSWPRVTQPGSPELDLDPGIRPPPPPPPQPPSCVAHLQNPHS